MRPTTPLITLGLLTLGAAANAQEAPPDEQLVGEAPTEGAASESAQPDAPTPSGPPKTVRNDLGFGDYGVSREYYFPDESRFRPRVDRRDEIDASSDRTILWPTAHTPDKNTLALSNHMLVLSQVSYSPTDDLQLTGSLVVPFDVAHTHVALSAKVTLLEDANYTFSIQPFSQLRRSALELASTDFGVGATALFDLIASNDLVITFGAVAYGTLVASTQVASLDDCESRSEVIAGTCGDSVAETTAVPAGGHFVGVQAAATWYIFDDWSLRGEAMTGVAAGSVLGSEWLTRRVTPSDETERFDTGPAATGIPYDTDITLGMGLQWSNGLLAFQFSGYALSAPWTFDPDSGERRIYFVPMFNGGLAFF